MHKKITTSEELDAAEVLAEMRQCVRVERYTTAVRVPVAHLAAVTAEVDRLRAALATARRDALTEAARALREAADAAQYDLTNEIGSGHTTTTYPVRSWLRNRAAQEGGGGPMSDPKMTDRQARAFKEAVADIRSRGVDIDDDMGRYTWHVRWSPESRPGRGHFMSAVWCDGEHLVQVTMDVYGDPSVGIADIDWTHSDIDDQCGCERCADEREQEEDR